MINEWQHRLLQSLNESKDDSSEEWLKYNQAKMAVLPAQDAYFNACEKVFAQISQSLRKSTMHNPAISSMKVAYKKTEHNKESLNGESTATLKINKTNVFIQIKSGYVDNVIVGGGKRIKIEEVHPYDIAMEILQHMDLIPKVS